MDEINTNAAREWSRRAAVVPEKAAHWRAQVDDLCDALDAARAEIARLAAERDAAVELMDKARENTETRMMSQAEAQVAAVWAGLGDDDCPNGFEAGERGCGCTVCRVRAALDGAAPCMALDCGLSWPHAAADHG